MKLKNLFVLLSASSFHFFYAAASSPATNSHTLNYQELLSERSHLDGLAFEVMQNTIMAGQLESVGFDTKVRKDLLFTKYKVDGGEVQDQKQSGRCWIFSAERMISEEARKMFGPKFSFSQNYIAYFDKLERFNFILDRFYKNKEPITSSPTSISEETQYLIKNMDDGGEWEFFSNIVEKYGVVPQEVMPETENSTKSGYYGSLISQLLKTALLEVSTLLQLEVDSATKDETFLKIKSDYLANIKQLLNIFLGNPPQDSNEEGRFIYLNKDKEMISYTPKEFQALTQVDLSNYIHLAHLPYHKKSIRSVACAAEVESTEDEEGMTTETLYKMVRADVCGNVFEGDRLQALLVTMHDIKETLRASIKEGKGAMIGSSMRHLDRKKCFFSIGQDLKWQLFNPSLMLIPKADRLVSGIDTIAHAMYLVGCDDKKPTPEFAIADRAPSLGAEMFGAKWQVQNSWGDTASNLFMSDDWFNEYVQSVVVDKRYLSEELKAILATDVEIIEIDHKDPFTHVTSL